MAVFSDYISDIDVSECAKTVTLTFTGDVSLGDIMTFPSGTVMISGKHVTYTDPVLTFGSEITSGDTVVMEFPLLETPYLMIYNSKVEMGSFYEPIYFDCDESGNCDDCYSCDYINHGRLYNKRISGLLTHTRYNTEHDKYMLNFVYNESESRIEMTDTALDLVTDTHPIPYAYSKFLILTYMSYDPDSGKFYEQIVYSSGINKDIVGADGFESWNYDIEKDPMKCWYHNDECVEVEEDFTNATIQIEYIGADGTHLMANKVYPILYSNDVSSESDKKYVDGIYKTYYFMVRDIVQGSASVSVNKGNAVRFLNTLGSGTMDYVLIANDNYDIVTTPTTILINGTYSFTASNYTELLTSELFTVVEAEDNNGTVTYAPMELLKHISYLACGELQPENVLQQIMAEEMHIVTYELAYEILESIEDCSVPCERFSFDEWMSLRQKHLAANTHFCKGNIMKAALELYTARKRCKNC